VFAITPLAARASVAKSAAPVDFITIDRSQRASAVPMARAHAHPWRFNMQRGRRSPLPQWFAAMLVLAVALPAAALPLFGPTKYTRQAGPPNVFTGTFQRCGNGPATLVVVNGNADGSNRISAASLVLNGTEVVGPGDFNQQVDRIEKAVQVTAENTLSIRLTSKPGSFITVTIEGAASPADLEALAPGASLILPGQLAVAVTVANDGTAPAENVQVTTLTLPGGTLITPTLPHSLGTIGAPGSAVLQASFSGPFVPGSTLPLAIAGTYAVGTSTFCFSLEAEVAIPPGAPGFGTLDTATIAPQNVTGAPFAPRDPEFDDDETNPNGWTVPNGPIVPPDGPPPGATQLQMGTQKGAAQIEAGLVEFTRNKSTGISTGSTTAEPSGASGGGVVFMTSNWWAAFSTDEGATWTQLNPTAVFPADAVGYCCDQIVQYVPSIDRFVWLLQGNGDRLAVASPQAIRNSNGTAWTYWNLTPQVFGQPNGTGFDYPDMAVGNNALYMSWDAGAGCPSGCTSGFQVVRTSLAGLQAGGTITIEYTNPANGKMAWGSHLSQDTGNEIFWAGHNSNSQMRIFSLAEGSNTYFWRDRNVSSWPNNAPTSLTPDNQDWLAKNFNGPGGNSFPRNGVIGATRTSGQVWFGWTAGTNERFQQAHVELVAFDPGNNYNKVRQVQVWNNNYAFAYPALATNVCTGEIGMALEFGGGGNYENHVVGFWGDFVVYQTTGSDVGTVRFGDYVTLRQRPLGEDNGGNLFDAFGYGLRTVAGVTRPDVRYITFGRPSSVCNVIPAPAPKRPLAPVVVASAGGAADRMELKRTPGRMEVSFAQRSAGQVDLVVYDIRGREVSRQAGSYPAGASTMSWNGQDNDGLAVPSGVYLFRMQTSTATHSAKSVWLR
jgi:hypothetical protein